MWSDYPTGAYWGTFPTEDAANDEAARLAVKLNRPMVVRHEPGERSFHVHALQRVEQPAWVARNVRHDVPRVAVKELAR